MYDIPIQVPLRAIPSNRKSATCAAYGKRGFTDVICKYLIAPIPYSESVILSRNFRGCPGNECISLNVSILVIIIVSVM